MQRVLKGSSRMCYKVIESVQILKRKYFACLGRGSSCWNILCCDIGATQFTPENSWPITFPCEDEFSLLDHFHHVLSSSKLPSFCFSCSITSTCQGRTWRLFSRSHLATPEATVSSRSGAYPRTRRPSWIFSGAGRKAAEPKIACLTMAESSNGTSCAYRLKYTGLFEHLLYVFVCARPYAIGNTKNVYGIWSYKCIWYTGHRQLIPGQKNSMRVRVSVNEDDVTQKYHRCTC